MMINTDERMRFINQICKLQSKNAQLQRTITQQQEFIDRMQANVEFNQRLVASSR